MVSIAWAYQFAAQAELFTFTVPSLLEEKRLIASNKQNIQPWLHLFQQTIQTLHIHPALLFNLDETPLSLTEHYHYSELKALNEPKPIAMMTERMANITVVLSIPALGSALPTVLLWPSKTLPPELSSLAAFDIIVMPNSTGWQSISSFESMMKTIIVPSIVKKRDSLNMKDQYALLLLDSHSSRFTSSTWELCNANHIVALTIPSHTSHILQPLDRSCNGVLKRVFFNRMITELNRAVEQEPELGKEIDLEPLRSPRRIKSTTFLPTTPPAPQQKHSYINPKWNETRAYINELSEKRRKPHFQPPQFRFLNPLQTHLVVGPQPPNPLQSLTSIPSNPISVSHMVSSTTQHDIQLSSPQLSSDSDGKTSDALRLRGGYKRTKRKKLTVDPDWQPDPAEEKISHAAAQRNLFVAAFPVAIQKATAKEVIDHGWKQSGLYPFQGQSLLDSLPDGHPYHPTETPIPLISGKIITSDDVIRDIKKLEEKRSRIKTETEQRKQRAEEARVDTQKRRERYLMELHSSLPAGQVSDAWTPRFTAAIHDSQIATQSVQSDTVEMPFPTTNPPDTTELQFPTGTILLPSVDNSSIDEQMESETID